MTVGQNKVVSVTYALMVREAGQTEEVFVEKTDETNPFVFLSGFGGVLPEFEKNLEGLKVGDAFDFILDAANGYGLIENDMLIEIPIGAFVGPDGKIEEGLLQAGNVLPMRDSEGNHLEGTIRQVGVENVVMDFNHPLAGKDLHFSGTVIELREATPEEMDHGHVHGPHGHHH
jgi:FKBP-type peptidyl-prolyl cis-trans isomerase SlyD